MSLTPEQWPFAGVNKNDDEKELRKQFAELKNCRVKVVGDELHMQTRPGYQDVAIEGLDSDEHPTANYYWGSAKKHVVMTNKGRLYEVFEISTGVYGSSLLADLYDLIGNELTDLGFPVDNTEITDMTLDCMTVMDDRLYFGTTLEATTYDDEGAVVSVASESRMFSKGYTLDGDNLITEVETSWATEGTPDSAVYPFVGAIHRDSGPVAYWDGVLYVGLGTKLYSFDGSSFTELGTCDDTITTMTSMSPYESLSIGCAGFIYRYDLTTATLAKQNAIDYTDDTLCIGFSNGEAGEIFARADGIYYNNAGTIDTLAGYTLDTLEEYTKVCVYKHEATSGFGVYFFTNQGRTIRCYYDGASFQIMQVKNRPSNTTADCGIVGAFAFNDYANVLVITDEADEDGNYLCASFECVNNLVAVLHATAGLYTGVGEYNGARIYPLGAEKYLVFRRDSLGVSFDFFEWDVTTNILTYKGIILGGGSGTPAPQISGLLEDSGYIYLFMVCPSTGGADLFYRIDLTDYSVEQYCPGSLSGASAGVGAIMGIRNGYTYYLGGDVGGGVMKYSAPLGINTSLVTPLTDASPEEIPFSFGESLRYCYYVDGVACYKYDLDSETATVYFTLASGPTHLWWSNEDSCLYYIWVDGTTPKVYWWDEVGGSGVLVEEFDSGDVVPSYAGSDGGANNFTGSGDYLFIPLIPNGLTTTYVAVVSISAGTRREILPINDGNNRNCTNLIIDTTLSGGQIRLVFYAGEIAGSATWAAVSYTLEDLDGGWTTTWEPFEFQTYSHDGVDTPGTPAANLFLEYYEPAVENGKLYLLYSSSNLGDINTRVDDYSGSPIVQDYFEQFDMLRGTFTASYWLGPMVETFVNQHKYFTKNYSGVKTGAVVLLDTSGVPTFTKYDLPDAQPSAVIEPYSPSGLEDDLLVLLPNGKLYQFDASLTTYVLLYDASAVLGEFYYAGTPVAGAHIYIVGQALSGSSLQVVKITTLGVLVNLANLTGTTGSTVFSSAKVVWKETNTAYARVYVAYSDNIFSVYMDNNGTISSSYRKTSFCSAGDRITAWHFDLTERVLVGCSTTGEIYESFFVDASWLAPVYSKKTNAGVALYGIVQKWFGTAPSRIRYIYVGGADGLYVILNNNQAQLLISRNPGDVDEENYDHQVGNILFDTSGTKNGICFLNENAYTLFPVQGDYLHAYEVAEPWSLEFIDVGNAKSNPEDASEDPAPLLFVLYNGTLCWYKSTGTSGAVFLYWDDATGAYSTTVIEPVRSAAYASGLLWIAFEGTDRFTISLPREYVHFDETVWFRANHSHNEILKMKSMMDFVFIGNHENVEVWAYTNSGELDTMASGVAVIKSGVLARNSFFEGPGFIGWLDPSRNTVLTSGPVQPTALPNTIIKEIFNLGLAAENCVIHYCKVEQLEFIILVFPDVSSTYVYDVGTQMFYEWEGLQIKSTAYDIPSGMTFAVVDQKLVVIDANLVADYDESGVASDIEVNIRTGFFNWGTDKAKIDWKLAFSLVKNSTDTEHMMVRYLDKNGGSWSNWRYIPLTDHGEFVVSAYSFGWYRERQWELNYNGSYGITLKGVVNYREDMEL
jgi:hypothetical protein